jgi:hypothetical protein
MAQQVEVVEHYWGWCTKYYIPYPCRKTRTVKKWCSEGALGCGPLSSLAR